MNSPTNFDYPGEPPVSSGQDSAPPSPLSATATTAITEAIVAVRLGKTEFGLPISRVREVLRTPPICRIPFPPPAVCGVTSLRGEVIPVMDLGMRLLAQPAIRPGRLLVVRMGATGPLGLLVDSITGILLREGIEIRDPPPEAEATLPHGWVAAVVAPDDGRLVTLLDLDPVLAREGHA